MAKLGYMAFCAAHVEVVRPVFDRMDWTGIEIVVVRTPHDPSGRNVAETVAYLEERRIPYAVEPRCKYDVLMSCIILDGSSVKRYAHRGTRLVRIMYSAAGKNYTYGADNGAYDLILTVGPYSEERLRDVAPCVSVGMPRYDALHGGRLDAAALKRAYGIGAGRPMLLYLPTWGVECSIDRYAEKIIGSADRFEVVVKPHPLTCLRETHRLRFFSQTGVRLITEDCSLVELLAMADVVVSDYSGSLFEALAADKRLLLLDLDAQTLGDSRLYEKEGPEHQYRDVAPRVRGPEEYEVRLAEALADAEPWPTRRRECAERFFAHRDGSSGEKAARAMENFIGRHRLAMAFGRWRDRLESGPERLLDLYERCRPRIGLGRKLRRLLRGGARR